MKTTVYFTSSRAYEHQSLLNKWGRLIDRVGIEFISEGELVAIKLHFGETLGTSFLRPIYARKMVEKVRQRGGKPFLTDSNTLYRGARQNAVDHLLLALRNGFGYESTGAPIIIADGIQSHDFVEVKVNLKHFQVVRYGSNVHYADSLVCLSHFKGHMLTGFGGTLKNIGMGLASRATKQQMHAEVRPEFRDEALCTGCGKCVEVCPSGAVTMEEEKPIFDHGLCVGCADCIVFCPQRALRVLWTEKPERVGEKIAEAVWAVLQAKKGKFAFFNFLLDITPDCDCAPWSDNPVVSNIGILGSKDPVAIDQASADLVNHQRGLTNSALTSAFKPGGDKFRALHPNVDWTAQLKYAEKIGLGSRRYQLYDIDRGEIVSLSEIPS